MFTESSLTWRASFTMFSSTIIYRHGSSEFVRRMMKSIGKESIDIFVLDYAYWSAMH